MDQTQDRTLARMALMQKTFETEGWREIQDELRNEIEGIKAALLTAATWEETKFLQGRSEQCLQLLYLPDTVDNIIEHYKEEADADV